MSDLKCVFIQDVINELNDQWKEGGGYFVERCIERVLQIPSIDSPGKNVCVNRWIPCSERLPENNEICLVCGKKGGIRVARVYLPAATGHWNGDPNTNWWTIVGTGKSYHPVAWMPLPEPYQAESEDKE